MRTLFASTLASALAATLFAAACTDDSSMPEPTSETVGVISVGASSARVLRNASISIDVAVTRDANATGEITVVLEDVPAGVSAAPLVLAPGATSGKLVVTAVAEIALGTLATTTLRATADDGAEATAPLDLALVDKAGVLDLSFMLAGYKTGSFLANGTPEVDQIIRQPDGKLLVGAADQFNNKYVIARFLPSGDLDTPFGTDGTIDVPGAGWQKVPVSFGLRADGSILVGWTGYNSSQVTAFDANGEVIPTYGVGYPTAGTAWLTLSDGWGASFYFQTMHVNPDGSAYVVSSFNGKFGIARIDANGMPDKTFDGDGYATIAFGGYSVWPTSVAVWPDGKILIGGWYDPSGALPHRIAFAQLNKNGTLDTSFFGTGSRVLDMGVTTGIDTMTTLSDGRIAATVSGLGMSVMFVRPDGSFDMSSYPGTGTVHRMFEHDGALYGLGTKDLEALVMKTSLAGTLDTSFGEAGFATDSMVPLTETWTAAAVDDQGRLLLGGSAALPNTKSQYMIGRMWL